MTKNNGDDAVAVADVEAQGNVKVGASHLTNATGSSGFGSFVLLDLNDSAVMISRVRLIESNEQFHL